MDQLFDVKRLLGGSGIRWWLDSGTLLGMIRENRIFPWDNDVDIGAWLHDDEVLRGVLMGGRCGDLGYICRRLTFRGRAWMYKLVPIVPGSGLRITIMLYDKKDGRYDCPAYYKAPNPGRGLSWLLSGLVRTPIRLMAKPLFHLLNDRAVLTDRFPFKIHYKEAYFSIPEPFFERFTEWNGLPVPEYYLPYLDFRYGDWRTPLTKGDEYVWWRDDGSVRLVGGVCG